MGTLNCNCCYRVPEKSEIIFNNNLADKTSREYKLRKSKEKELDQMLCN